MQMMELQGKLRQEQDNPKRIAVVTAVSPVLPPSVTPEALSTNVVVVDVPSTAPAVVAIASARSAPFDLWKLLPSSSKILALEDTPISVPIVSNISTNRNAKTTTAKSNVTYRQTEFAKNRCKTWDKSVAEIWQ